MKPKFKIFISSLLLIVVIFSAVPKSYIHSFFGHKHDVFNSITSSIKISENEETRDCDFEKYDTPIYYTVFKFILNFLPITSKKETSFLYNQNQRSNSFYSISFLRGPPLA